MKTILYTYTLLLFSSLCAQNDTINRFDSLQVKQGYWINYFESTDKILEEGRYIDDKRTGIWKQYLEDGTLSSEITYLNDEPNGYAKIYYPNSKIAEEGMWKGDVWVGQYIAYYPNGKVNYKWNFSEEGSRTGKQEYFHENGNKMISGNWDNGKESGVIKRYNKNGSLIEEQTFNNGKLNPEFTVKHKPKPEKEITHETSTTQKDTVPEKELENFNSTGERKLFDKKRRLWQEGYFEEGQLIKGKKYYYNSKDEVIKTVIYKNGRVYDTKITKQKE